VHDQINSYKNVQTQSMYRPVIQIFFIWGTVFYCYANCRVKKRKKKKKGDIQMVCFDIKIKIY